MFELTPDEDRKMKPFYTVDQLIEELRYSTVDPLTFTESEISFAQEFFSYTNYYSFSIYKKQLPKKAGKAYSFSDCMVLYDFNYYLRSELNRITGKIELMLKSSFLKSVCQNYEGELQKGECYLDSNLYRNIEEFEEVKLIMERIVSESKTLPIRHHLENKKGKIPLWVVMPELTFGETTGLISSMKDEIKNQWIEDSFISLNRIDRKIHGEELKNKIYGWFSAAWYIRNRCAHYSRLYGCNFNVANPGFFSIDFRKIKKYGKKKNHNKDLFAYMLAIKNILVFHSLVTQSEWNVFLNGMQIYLASNSGILIPSKIGLTDNWYECLKIM